MAAHPQIAAKVAALNVANTVSGAVVTITGNLTHRQLEDLADAAYVTGHNVSVVAGVVKISPGIN
jgi:hypothetical protein